MQSSPDLVEEVVFRVVRGSPVETNEKLEVTGLEQGALLTGSLYPGDTIASVQGHPVATRSEFHRLVSTGGTPLRLRVRRGPNSPPNSPHTSPPTSACLPVAPTASGSGSLPNTSTQAGTPSPASIPIATTPAATPSANTVPASTTTVPTAVVSSSISSTTPPNDMSNNSGRSSSATVSTSEGVNASVNTKRGSKLAPGAALAKSLANASGYTVTTRSNEAASVHSSSGGRTFATTSVSLRSNIDDTCRDSERSASVSAPVPVAAPSQGPFLPGWSGNPKEIPAQWEAILRRRGGYDYLAIPVAWTPQRKLGINLSYHGREVVVSMLVPGSVGDDAFQLLDRIIAVNGVNVRSETHAKQIMIGSKGRFIALVERPVTMEAHRAIIPSNQCAYEPSLASVALSVATAGESAAEIPKDVKGISELQRRRHRASGHIVPRSILKAAGMAALPNSRRISIPSVGASLVTIPNDVPASVVLKHVPGPPPSVAFA